MAPAATAGLGAADLMGVARQRRGALAPLLGVALFAGIISGQYSFLYRWQERAEAGWAARQQAQAESAPGIVELVAPGRVEEPETLLRPVPRPELPLPPARARGRLAIVIDDWGYDWQAAGAFLSLEGPVTVAVIPGLPRSRQHALQARARGFEVIVHLPMEPLDASIDAGPRAITTGMSGEEIRRVVAEAIDAVPGAVGVSNHMGSKATADARVMEHVLEVVRERGLFFLDSATSPGSVTGLVAERLGVRWAHNGAFVDGEPTVRAVRARLEQAVRQAERTGQAVAIGHVKPATAVAVGMLLPELAQRGIVLVPVSELVGR